MQGAMLDIEQILKLEMMEKLSLNEIDTSNYYAYHAWNAHISAFIFIKDCVSFFKKSNEAQFRILTKALRKEMPGENLSNVTFSPSAFSETQKWIVI